MSEDRKPRRTGLTPPPPPPVEPEYFEDDDDFEDDDVAAPVSPLNNKGWGAMATKVELTANTRLPELIIKSGEDVVIQFLDDEPTTLVFHTGSSDRKVFDQLVCQKEAGHKTCVMCNNNVKRQARSIFRVLDTRGEYKDGHHVGGAPVEKYFEMSARLSEDIHLMLLKRQEKTKNPRLTLLDIMVEVTRKGEGKDTRWGFAVAMDENDRVLVPNKGIRPKLAEPAVAYKPMPTEALAQLNVRNKAF